MRRRLWQLAAVLALMLALAGCGDMKVTFNPQELYSLPELPAKYTQLNAQINEILTAGAEYAAPVAGSNVQPVQMLDLDGDGQEEALAFFRNAADEKPLKICIFTGSGETYQQTAVIEGSGTAIYSIAYHDIDNDGRTELLVGWRVGTELQALSVYALRAGGPEELLRTDYVKYSVTDLDQDQLRELVVLRSMDGGSGGAEYYTYQDGTLKLRNVVRVSMTMAELSQQGRVKSGVLADGAPALFVTGVGESMSAATDILAVRNDELANILLSDVTGVTSEVAPFSALYPEDINGDGVTEVPRAVSIPSWGNVGEDTCRRIDWYAYDSTGTGTAVMSTYHDMEDGWYLHLPDSWRDQILITRTAGQEESSVTFSIRGDETVPPRDFLRITRLTGSSREIKAARGGRIILRRQPEAIFTAELLDANGDWEFGLTEEQVREAFSLIIMEWSAGDS